MHKLWISTGASRKEMNWKNVELHWETLLEKFKTPVTTKETYAQYMSLAKDDQDEIKDVGGFVGGIINGGRRGINSVTSRSMLTLDIEGAGVTNNFWDDFCMLYSCEAALYTTHKHSNDNPRYRLIIPLERDVLPDEHEAVARRIAGNLGINLFDPTTFQTERLMYWPSISIGGEFVFKRQKGEWMVPDTVLSEYADWRDMTQWPISEKVKKKQLKEAEKQEDPEDKNGVVGVFCRIYGIKEAISKFLTDVYEETRYEDRYTYKAGSTSAGVIVHDNKFSLSFHSTDPTCGRLCNAFDLVRIHLFGDSDDRVDSRTPHQKRPSYGKMIELATNDGEVKKLMLAERMEDKAILDGGEALTTEQLGEWAEKLDCDRKGNVMNTIQNCVIILQNDPRVCDNLCYNDLSKDSLLRRDLPWRKIGQYKDLMTDADDSEFMNFFESQYGITSEKKIKDAIEICIHRNTFHPVKQYLESFVWDKVERAEKLFIDLLGAEDSVYVRQVTRKLLTAAVARIYQPGIKFDHLIVLVGVQGIGKSLLVSKLAADWGSDTFGNVHSNSAMENIQGVWIMEIGELAGLKNKDLEAIKLYIAKPVDRFRVAYGKRVQVFPRQCIFIGTTNSDDFLQDQTGNRRYWPIACTKKLDLRKLSKEFIGQVWAEVCEWYVMGEDLFLDDSVEAMAKEVQEQYTEKDDRAGKIEACVSVMVPKNWYEMSIFDKRAYLEGDEQYGKPEMYRDYITIPEIWEEVFKGQSKDMNTYNVKFIRNVMNKMNGWEKKMINRKPYGYQRGWSRIGSEVASWNPENN